MRWHAGTSDQEVLPQIRFFSSAELRTPLADGVWGPGTQNALLQFQRSRGLEATGQLNPTTISALGFDPNNLSGSAGVR